jgi:DNA-binding SARP family transcriptional activator
MSNHHDAKTHFDAPESNAVSLAKLSMPRSAKGVARPRLHTALDEARRAAAVWMVAPGGAGKTTLAATYIAERKLPFLWYQADKDDADPATFFYYLGLAARQFQPSREVILPLLTPEYLHDIPGFTRRYFRRLFTLLPRPSVVVLDNYQDLRGSEVINELLRNAIGEVPEGGNIVVMSRMPPPPDLVRLQVTGALEVITWEELRLTYDETEAIVNRHGTKLDAKIIRALHERSEGWAAGLTLLLKQIKKKGLEDHGIGLGSLERIFDFFASEFFNELPAATRDFLLQTSLLSHITPSLAAAVSGNGDADQILAGLHHQHFFTSRRDLPEVTYQYHALFREFLLARAADTYTREQYLELTRNTGRLLNERGRNEEAVALHLQARDWEMAIPLLLKQAPRLLAQGRAQTVTGWIEQMPEELVKLAPWLMYWKGVSEQFVDPFKARATLEQAYDGFSAGQDVIGRMLAASAIIDIVYILRESLLLTARWVDILQNRLSDNVVFPSPEIEARILSSLLSVLELMKPYDSRLPCYIDRLVMLLDEEFDVNQKILLAGRLIIYFAMIEGNTRSCDRITLHVRPLLNSPELAASSRFSWKILSVLPYLFTDSRSAVVCESIDSLLSMIKDDKLSESLNEKNLSYLEFIASFYVSLLYLHFNDGKAVKPLLDRMESMVIRPQSIDAAILLMVKCLYALGQGDRESAFRYGQASLQIHSNVGATITGLEVSCIIAIERCESGKPEEAFGYLAMPRNQGCTNSPRMCYQIFLIEAYAYLQLGNIPKCHERLSAAFNLGHIHGYFGTIFWLLRILPRLCAEALRGGIEVDYVHRLIRKRGLLPEDSGIENWPWPIRIYTLGQFKMILDNRPIAETKAQYKPFKLLRALIALGGKDVKEERISEILWPDADGDAAHSAFTTTLSRLRKLIGDETITVKSGRVSLDRLRCWVDAWSFEDRIDQLQKVGADPENLRALADKLVTLYRGHFMSDEEGVWAEKLRQRLQSMYFRFISHYGRVLNATRKDGEHTIHPFESGLDIDLSTDDLHRSLTAGHVASGLNDEMSVTHTRYQDITSDDRIITSSGEDENIP